MARRHGPRGLSNEERALWRRVAEQAVPLHPPGRPPPARPDAPLPKPQAQPERPPLAPFTLGERAGETRPVYAPAQPAPTVVMDHKAFQRMKRGKLRIEGRLDLHGMTLDQAQPALTGFILDAQASGKRLVLIITGKGRGNGGLSTREGALKRQVPHWLRMGALAGIVMQVNPAHQSHGGSGAYYVYLRRRR